MPPPEQNDAGWKVAPVHDGVPQNAPGWPCVQPLAPLHVPVLPQGGFAGHWPAGAGVPAGIGVHIPGDVPAQVSQVPQAALPQQTPLTQAPLSHWFAPPQAAPFAFLATQLPAALALPVQ